MKRMVKYRLQMYALLLAQIIVWFFGYSTGSSGIEAIASAAFFYLAYLLIKAEVTEYEFRNRLMNGPLGRRVR